SEALAPFCRLEKRHLLRWIAKPLELGDLVAHDQYVSAVDAGFERTAVEREVRIDFRVGRIRHRPRHPALGDARIAEDVTVGRRRRRIDSDGAVRKIAIAIVLPELVDADKRLTGQ